MSHEWYVSHAVEGPGYGRSVYEARCGCGWQFRTEDEQLAALAALDHLGSDSRPVEAPKNHRGPLQKERLFDD